MIDTNIERLRFVSQQSSCPTAESLLHEFVRIMAPEVARRISVDPVLESKECSDVNVLQDEKKD